MERIFQITFSYLGRPFFDKTNDFVKYMEPVTNTVYNGYIILREDDTIIGYTHYGVIEGRNNSKIQEKGENFILEYEIFEDLRRISNMIQKLIKLDNGIIVFIKIIPEEYDDKKLKRKYGIINRMLRVLPVNVQRSFRKRYGIY